jgi:hypothetical protein
MTTPAKMTGYFLIKHLQCRFFAGLYVGISAVRKYEIG